MKHSFSILRSLYIHVLLSLLCIVLLSQHAYSQVATATWALTASANVAIVGNVTGTAHTFGSGLTTTSYNATNGATAANFNGRVATPNTDDYFEFTETPAGCNDLTISSVTFTYLASNSGKIAHLKYSINGSSEIQIGNNLNTTSSNFNSGALSIVVPAGKTITFRIYGATNNTTTTIAVKNFVITGNTAVSTYTPSITIAATPSVAVCSGTSVTFDATATNGGTTPSYQWSVNGVDLGTNSTSYSNAALANGNTVKCVVTNNICSTTATSNIITVSINSTPATPGIITGASTTAPTNANYIYSIAAVSGATSYNWTLPTGWAINNGSGTNFISVTSGSVGQNGNIAVTASNACGTSATSSLSVIVIATHNTCNQCHITHTAPAGQLTAINGNANLCISCHNPSGTASYKAFNNAMKAVPGTSGTSHRWDMAAVNAMYGANKPTNTLVDVLPGDSIICSTCHNQHPSNTNDSYLRVANTNDALCKNCHASKVKSTYASNPSNKGSHPVDVTYNTADSRFNSSTTLPLNSGNVICSTCHSTHAATSADGNLLRESNVDNLCASCHVTQSYGSTRSHKGMTCSTCHYSHQSGSGNIYLINDTIVTPNSGSKPVVFTGNTTATNFADASGTYNGVCEVCHTSTDHYTNTAGGIADARHVPATQTCVTCHPHDKGFYAQSNCFDCHNTTQGARRQIVDAAGNGTGIGGDFIRTSHHVTGSIPSVDDCIKCHYMGDHKLGTVKLLDPDQGYNNIITYNVADNTSIEIFCVNCHDSNGANGDLTPFSDNVSVPNIDATMWAASSHKNNVNANTCLVCHDNGHGSNKKSLLAPYNKVNDAIGDIRDDEEDFCLNCHDGSPATLNMTPEFAKTTKHNVGGYNSIHSSNEATLMATKHVECVDCHNPHAANSTTAIAPTANGLLLGALGINAAGTSVNPATNQYEVCFRCHSSVPAATVTTTRVLVSNNTRLEFATTNPSFHPVVGARNNSEVISLLYPNTPSTQLYCTSCHNNNTATPKGPHGSTNTKILKLKYSTADGTSESAANHALCYSCHDRNSIINDNSFPWHRTHIVGESSPCNTCHDPHGVPGTVSNNTNLINFNTAIVTPYNGELKFIDTGVRKGSCQLECHGVIHEPKTY